MARSDHAPIVLYTRTNAFRHGPAIEAGIEAVREQAIIRLVPVAVTDDPAFFDSELLDEAGAVVFLNASGNVLNDGQKGRFLHYLRGGGGFAGVHFATGAETDWPEFDEVIGTRFAGHPGKAAQRGIISVHDEDHPSTAHLPSPWAWAEEWHAFTAPLAPSAHLLLSVDAASYDSEGTGMQDPHPVSWCSEYENGRTWFTSLGHHAASYGDPLFRAHLWGGIDWARRRPRRPETE